jgi:hypothetical protein
MGIAYHDGRNRDLRYVEKTGESWGKPEVVHYESDQGRYSSLVLDAEGTPHISYYYNGPDVLMYAIRRDDGWQRTTVDANGQVGFNTSIALDPQGKPHIVYQNGGTKNCVMYASYISDGYWTIEEVKESKVTSVLMPCDRDDAGFPIPLAIDASGVPHISWVTVTATGRDFAYATKPTNGDWEITIIDDTDQVGYNASIALDGQGNPHISYIEGGDVKELRYVRKMGNGPWQVDPITAAEPANECYYPTSIGIDARGTIHISYFNANYNLGHLVKPASGGWTYEVADDQGDVGRYCSLVLDAQGKPYISYWDLTNNNLKCAVRTDNGWACTIADDAPTVGRFTSISLIYR